MQYIPIQKIEALQNEIKALRKKPRKKVSKNKDSLAGLLKGMKFSELVKKGAGRSTFCDVKKIHLFK